MTAPAKAAPMREDVTPLAYLKEWHTDGTPCRRVDLTSDNEPWLQAYHPTITPLFARLAHTARPDAGDEDVERVALREIAEMTKRQQLPITSQIHEIATAALVAMREGVDRGMVERAKEIEEAAKAVLVFQCGQAPSLGYIKDNDRSRAAIARLAAALSPEQPR